jgi:predicted Fe-Mo cluster-binding NifX family protein
MTVDGHVWLYSALSRNPEILLTAKIKSFKSDERCLATNPELTQSFNVIGGIRMKLAIPTNGEKGLEDTVSKVFGKAKTFTILEVKNSIIGNVEVIKNPAASYKHGAGPIVVIMLADKKVDIVAARELGLGASTLLEHNGIRRFKVEAGVHVRVAVQKLLEEISGKL